MCYSLKSLHYSFKVGNAFKDFSFSQFLMCVSVALKEWERRVQSLRITAPIWGHILPNSLLCPVLVGSRPPEPSRPLTCECTHRYLNLRSRVSKSESFKMRLWCVEMFTGPQTFPFLAWQHSLLHLDTTDSYGPISYSNCFKIAC